MGEIVEIGITSLSARIYLMRIDDSRMNTNTKFMRPSSVSWWVMDPTIYPKPKGK